MRDADQEQHREPSPVDALRVPPSRIETLHLQIEAEPEQECEHRVRLVQQRATEHRLDCVVQARRRQRQQLRLGRHHIPACKADEVHEEHAEQGESAQDIERLHALGGRQGRCVYGDDQAPVLVKKSRIAGFRCTSVAPRESRHIYMCFRGPGGW